jgi:hypothetical protein
MGWVWVSREIILSENDRNAGEYLQTVLIRPHSHTGSDEIRRSKRSSIHRDGIELPFNQDNTYSSRRKPATIQPHFTDDSCCKMLVKQSKKG